MFHRLVFWFIQEYFKTKEGKAKYRLHDIIFNAYNNYRTSPAGITLSLAIGQTLPETGSFGI
jgi:hypothetical protein